MRVEMDRRFDSLSRRMIGLSVGLWATILLTMILLRLLGLV